MKLSKCRVLLVDDHAPMREALRDLLMSYPDIQIIGEAADGNEAIELMASCRPDVILLDLNMPRMNGIEAANVIKKSWEDTVIIGLCAVRDPYSLDAFLKAGAIAVVSKDRCDNLYSTIQRACLSKHTPTL